MVNVNNYGVNNPNIGPATPYAGNYQTPSNPAVNAFNKNDSYAFNLSNVPTGKVPDVKVGMWDKVTAYFGDVTDSPENLKIYKEFKSAMEANPATYLQPGSSDAGKIRDLQKKFNFIGGNLVVNGEFGNATEKAVINFKKSVGINDGFLTKNGEYAVTPVVTPETWNLLNAQVAAKLNPNGNINGGSYIPPVTRDEILWAKDLQSRMTQLGYKPTPAEKQKYENIYQRQQMNISVQNGSFNPSVVAAPSQPEMDWARQLIAKIQQNGYKATPVERQKYEDIALRQKQAKQQQNQPVQQQVQNTVQPNALPGGVSPAEMAWATDLMNKVKNGYRTSPDEEIKYQDILIRSKSQQQNVAPQPPTQAEMQWAANLENKVNSQNYKATPQERAKYEDIYKRAQAGNNTAGNTQDPNSVPVSQAEITWAQQFENMVKNQGYKPSAEEKSRYESIYNRYTAVGIETKGNTPPAPVQKPTDLEVSWAMELERKSKQENYQPNQNELAIYNDIATRLENYTKAQQQANSATPDELAWASTMYGKMQNGYKPTPQEMNILSSIQSKIQAGAQPNNTTDATGNPVTPPVNNNPVVSNQNSTNNFTAVSEFAYNDQTINAFKAAFPGVTLQGGSIPYLPAAAGKQVAQQFGFGSVSELQNAVGAGVDGKFGPETYFRLMQNKNGGQTVSQPTTGSGQAGGVSQQELDWASDLQARFSNGYKPTQQEMTKYTDIYNRYQANGNQVSQPQGNKPVNNTNAGAGTGAGAPTQEELDWAVALQSKLSTGYQPTAQDKAKYQDIYNRYQANGNQVAGSTPVQNNQNQQPVYKPTVDPNTPMANIDQNNSDPDLQWALQLLDRVQQQNYMPTDAEIQKYEQIIAKNQSVAANP
jgi:hypothetical protein